MLLRRWRSKNVDAEKVRSFRTAPGERTIDLLKRFATFWSLLAGICGLAVTTPSIAWSWGCEGHEVVGLIAAKHLNTKAAAQTNQILQGNYRYEGVSHFCPADSTLPAIAQVSTWADDIRAANPATGGWHFRDIPLAYSGSLGSDQFCPETTGCVTRAIDQEIKTLKNLKSSHSQQKEALVFLIHFLGDLHQPLHCADNHDRGGNCVPVWYFGLQPKIQCDSPQQGYSLNLHGIWDTELVQRIDPEAVDLADKLDAEFSKQISVRLKEPVALDEWAKETHDLAASVVYKNLSKPIFATKNDAPVQSCAEGNTSKRYLDDHEQVDCAYANASELVIKEQLSKAGARLANILNGIWP
jgi:hypothetical protein